MTRPLARRAGPFLATGGLLLTAAGAVPAAQTVAAPAGAVPRGVQLQRVVFNETWEESRREPPLRLEPIEATTTR